MVSVKRIAIGLVCGVLLAGAWTVGSAQAEQDQERNQQQRSASVESASNGPSEQAATSSSSQASDHPHKNKAPSLPGIRIDRQARAVDIQARVANREAEWLELLACTPGGREWETILTVDAKPSHIHLALVLVGLKPGKPLTWTRTEDDYLIHPPRGDRVAVSLQYVDQTNRQMDIPANQWIRNSINGELLKDHHWVFAGSRMAKIDSQQGPKQVYLGDLEGNVLSLVNFGDDVLAKPNTRVNQNGEAIWIPRRSLIPAVGTPVTIRIAAAPAPKPDSAEKNGQADKAQDQADPSDGSSQPDQSGESSNTSGTDESE